MKRMIFILVVLFVALSCTNAQVKVYTDQLIADSITFNKTDWVNEWSKDATFGGNSDRAVPTEKAVVSYVAAQIAAITIGVTDTAEVTRLIGAYLDTVNISFTANYDATGDTLLTYKNGDFGYTFSFEDQLQDSLDKHTDSLQLHNVRIKAIKDTVILHNNRLKSLESAEDDGGGTVDLTGTPAINQIAYMSGDSSITGNSLFNFTTTTRTTASFYTGTSAYPNVSTYTLNYDGPFRAYSFVSGTTSANYVGMDVALRFFIQVSGVDRLLFNPSVTNGSSAIAYLFDTHTALTSNAKITSVKNNGTELSYQKTDTSVFVNSLKFRTRLYEWRLRGLADTVAALIYPGGVYDSASIVIAADGWDKKLENYWSFYKTSKKLKALPLPYPDLGTPEAHGQDRRMINEKFRNYQIERELERIHGYFFRLWAENKYQWLIIILLFGWIVRLEIKLRKK